VSATTLKQPETPAKKKSRIAHWLLPQIDENSALLPSDEWVKTTVRSIIKEDKGFRKAAGRILGFAGLGLAAIAGGIVAAVLLFPAAIPMAVAGAAALGVTGFAAKKTRDGVNRFKSENIPALKETVGKKYLEYKAAELKAEWKRKQAAYRAKKAAEKAEKEAREAAEKKAAAAAQALAEQAAAEKKAAEKANPPAEKGIRGFGKRMLREAMKRAQENLDDLSGKNAPPPAKSDEPPAPKKDGAAPK
jgi:hypothetical protein